MKYKILYLPVDKPLEDGCDIINSSGEHFIYNEAEDYWQKSGIKRAELFLVSMEFNQMFAIGKPDPALKWLKHGMDVKACDCEMWRYDVKNKMWINSYKKDEEILKNTNNFRNYWRVRCPTCGILH